MTAYAPSSEDRTLPFVVYALYLIGLFNGLTILIGLIIAYVARGNAGAVAASHYTFQIRSVWIALAGWIVGFVLLFWGIPLSFILIGIPLVMLGGLVFGLVHIWFGVRAILGLLCLSQGAPYPRPLGLLF